MHRKRLVLGALAALVTAGALALGGCGDAIMSGPSEVSDEQTLRDLMDEDEFFALGGPYGGEPIDLDYPESREGINPLNFWREITDRHINRDIWVDLEEGVAEVEIHGEVWGTFNIVDWEMVQYEKPLHHTGERYAVFELDEQWKPGEGQGEHHRRGPWHLSAISGWVSQSDTTTMAIDWVRVQSASVDTTITDPLALMDVPDDIMTFAMGEEVTVTVSGPPDDALLFLHTPLHRSAFQHQGDGTFQGTWTVSCPGPHSAWVEALAHDSLFDSEYPEDVLIWGMPYETAEE